MIAPWWLLLEGGTQQTMNAAKRDDGVPAWCLLYRLVCLLNLPTINAIFDWNFEKGIRWNVFKKRVGPSHVAVILRGLDRDTRRSTSKLVRFNGVRILCCKSLWTTHFWNIIKLNFAIFPFSVISIFWKISLIWALKKGRVGIQYSWHTFKDSSLSYSHLCFDGVAFCS